VPADEVRNSKQSRQNRRRSASRRRRVEKFPLPTGGYTIVGPVHGDWPTAGLDDTNEVNPPKVTKNFEPAARLLVHNALATSAEQIRADVESMTRQRGEV
jgi:hypothetical protein